MERNIFKNDYVEFYIENGILYGRFLKSLIVDTIIAQQVVDLRGNISNGKDYLTIVDMTNLKGATKDARKFMACSENGFRGIKAAAFISDKAISNLLLNLFLKINKPKKPCKYFIHKEEALKWLQTYE